MGSVVIALLLNLRTSLRHRVALHLEILALRHQLQVVERSRPRQVRITCADRVLWVWLSRVWDQWRATVLIVRPETVLAWHRRGFRCSGPGEADAAWVGRAFRPTFGN